MLPRPIWIICFLSKVSNHIQKTVQLRTNAISIERIKNRHWNLWRIIYKEGIEYLFLLILKTCFFSFLINSKAIINKGYMVRAGKARNYQTHILSSYLCCEVNFSTHKMQFVIASSGVILELHTLKWKCRFSKEVKVLIDSKCSFRNAVNFIQGLKSYFIKHQFPAPFTQNKSRKSFKKMIQLLKNQKQ